MVFALMRCCKRPLTRRDAQGKYERERRKAMIRIHDLARRIRQRKRHGNKRHDCRVITRAIGRGTIAQQDSSLVNHGVVRPL